MSQPVALHYVLDKMKNIVALFILTVCLFAICGCATKTTGNAISESVPSLKINADELVKTDIPNMGILSIRVFDSKLFVATSQSDNSWSVYKIPGNSLISKGVSVGQGPGEVMSTIPTDHASFIKKDSVDSVYLPESPHGRFLCFDISENMRNDFELGEIRDSRLTPMSAMSFKLNGDVTSYININPGEGRIDRIFAKGEQMITSLFVDSLNNQSVKKPQDIPELMFWPAISPSDPIIAEVNPIKGTVTVYNPVDGKLIRSIDLSEDNKTPSDRIKENTPVFIGAAIGYDDFFTVLKKVDNIEGAPCTTIIFIDWNGRVIGNISVRMNFHSCGIDVKDSTLYILNNEDDTVYQTNVSEFISEILNIQG